MDGISLIVGLGNPGSQYTDTRHNVGYRFITSLQEDFKLVFSSSSRFNAQLSSCTIAQRPVRVLTPNTFMNLSGGPVATVAHYYQIPTANILVIHDELDLPPGEIRLKQDGGHGGHNGLRDIISKLGSTAFARLRLGIGRPSATEQAAAYVLRAPAATEQALISSAIDLGRAQMVSMIEGHYQQAMNHLHRPRNLTTAKQESDDGF